MSDEKPMDKTFFRCLKRQDTVHGEQHQHPHSEIKLNTCHQDMPIDAHHVSMPNNKVVRKNQNIQYNDHPPSFILLPGFGQDGDESHPANCCKYNQGLLMRIKDSFDSSRKNGR